MAVRSLSMRLSQRLRRGFVVTAALVAVASLPSAGAFAQNWNQRFDNGGLDETRVLTVSPVLSPQVVAAVDNAIARYQQIVAAGGWPVVPADQQLRLGVQSPSVAVLRQRLIVSGDLAQAAGLSDTFDTFVDAAVRQFQARHGIPADGIVGPASFAALNVSADVRLRQLTINRQRLQELAPGAPGRYVLVNLPGAEIEAVENGQVVSRHTAVVGKVERPSPILTSAIYEVNFNPFWTVPASIIERDLIPLMQREPDYLTEQNIHMYNAQGQEVFPQNVNWNSNEATRYTFRQDPGELNALGSVRINFHNQFSVYLHDTPNKVLFGNDYRYDSSGCVRVQNVRQLIAWLLRDTPGWDRARVEQMFATGERINAPLASQVRLYFTYITAWANESGVVHFRSDIYGRDGVGDIATR